MKVKQNNSLLEDTCMLFVEFLDLNKCIQLNMWKSPLMTWNNHVDEDFIIPSHRTALYAGAKLCNLLPEELKTMLCEDPPTARGITVVHYFQPRSLHPHSSLLRAAVVLALVAVLVGGVVGIIRRSAKQKTKAYCHLENIGLQDTIDHWQYCTISCGGRVSVCQLFNDSSKLNSIRLADSS
ncbi:hypothetical protein J6590_093818 [Homalodisca vitripennis]|nr:hypothetical protein J6590_093818 [Homalodisca vitripennis]